MTNRSNPSRQPAHLAPRPTADPASHSGETVSQPGQVMESQVEHEITQTLEAFIEPNEAFEIRVIPPSASGGQVRSGIYRSTQRASQDAAMAQSGSLDSVYFSLNPLKQEAVLDGERDGRFECLGVGPACKKSDIDRRRYLLIDIDTVRPVGLPAESDELAEAKAVARQVMSYLCGHGLPVPWFADSGNGLHLCYRVEMPTDDRGLIKQVLVALAAKFDTAKAKIDTSVHDASRVVRLYGTMNFKGSPQPDRPHRKSRLISEKAPRVVSREELLKFVNQINLPTAISCTSSNEGKVVKKVGRRLRALKPATEGSLGDKAFFHAACVAARAGLSKPGVVNALTEYFNPRCEPARDDTAIDRVASAAVLKVRIGDKAKGLGQPWDDDEGDEEDTTLDEIIEERCSLFCDEELQEPFATVEIDHAAKGVPQGQTRYATHAIHSEEFRHLLERILFDSEGVLATKKMMESAVGQAAGLSRVQGNRHPTHLRTCSTNGKLYLDLGSADWKAVEVTPDGWRVIDRCPVKFRRSQPQLPLPIPIPGGKPEELRQVLNVGDDANLLLFFGWLLGALRGGIPCPMCVLTGEPGSAKTTAARACAMLVDPTKAGVRSFPKSEDDLLIAARSSHVLAFDNLSRITQEQSDMLCRLVSDGTLGKRKLYSDMDEIILRAQRPVLLTSIADVVVQHDLLQRSLLVQLPIISSSDRLEEEEVEQCFESLRPRLLGLLLDGVQSALAAKSKGTWKEIDGDNDRMLDFQRWAAHGMRGLGLDTSAFLEAFARSRSSASDLALQANVVASAIATMLPEVGYRWPAGDTQRGAKELLAELNNSRACHQFRTHRYWPRDPQALARELKKSASALRAKGIEVTIHDNRVRTDSSRIKPIEIVDTQRRTLPTPINSEITEVVESGEQDDLT